MDNSEKKRFKSHYKVLRRHYCLDYIPYAPRKNELNREDFLKRIKDDNFIVPNLTDEGFETAKSLSVFFDQRDTMSSKEFNKALTEKYGNELDIERDIREIENSEALRSIERNIKTMKGIMVFFLVMWIIGIVATIIYALAALT